MSYRKGDGCSCLVSVEDSAASSLCHSPQCNTGIRVKLNETELLFYDAPYPPCSRSSLPPPLTRNGNTPLLPPTERWESCNHVISENQLQPNTTRNELMVCVWREIYKIYFKPRCPCEIWASTLDTLTETFILSLTQPDFSGGINSMKRCYCSGGRARQDSKSGAAEDWASVVCSLSWAILAPPSMLSAGTHTVPASSASTVWLDSLIVWWASVSKQDTR